ncbi:MAG: hypothetical protein B1H05_02045 [Candidatus Cloacimonas sp. 4484_140]|nr:MAG: hypothetical protein B1H05_02045 [Candidatus Cloacimonas sp. 4484_140]
MDFLSNFATLNYLFLISIESNFFSTNKLSNENKQKNNIKIRIFLIPRMFIIPVKRAAAPKLNNVRL